MAVGRPPAPPASEPPPPTSIAADAWPSMSGNVVNEVEDDDGEVDDEEAADEAPDDGNDDGKDDVNDEADGVRKRLGMAPSIAAATVAEAVAAPKELAPLRSLAPPPLPPSVSYE